MGGREGEGEGEEGRGGTWEEGSRGKVMERKGEEGEDKERLTGWGRGGERGERGSGGKDMKKSTEFLDCRLLRYKAVE